jgi:peptidyl-tRNA hydrolase, PTH1 family
MKLVIGLGNPGKEYEGTRHNIGFDVIDSLAARLGWASPGEFDRRAKSAFNGLALDGMVSMHSTGSTDKLVLLKPTTYMNLSGRTVSGAMNYFKLTPGELIVIVDEMALPTGRLRLRPDGSDGGHNGLKSVQQCLGTSVYPRLRFGVSSPPPMIPGRDWVLGKFRPEEQKDVADGIARATGCIITWADEGLTRAMNVFNVKD